MARLDEQDFDEKRLSRRKRRKQGELFACIILVVFLLIVVGAIGTGVYFVRGLIKDRAPLQEEVQSEAAMAETAAVIETPEETPEPVEYTQDDLFKEIMDSVLQEMSLEDKVAGLFVVTPEQLTGVETAVKAGSGTQEALSNYAVGGIMYAPKNIKGTDQIKEMLDDTTAMSKYPLFTILSEQAGLSDSVKETLTLTPQEEITDSVSAHSAGLFVGSQLFKYSFNFAVTSIEVSEEGQFGQDPGEVKENADAYAQGLKESGITACGAVFPARTAADSESSVIDISKDDLVLSQYEAFKGVIDSGSCNAIMVTNSSFPQVTGDETPASLSGVMIGEELRGTLGFEGVVMTAPLNDSTITGRYSSGEAAIAAINAGADMICIPENFTESYEGLLGAVQSGQISEERINESLRRIYRIKYADRVDQISQGN